MLRIYLRQHRHVSVLFHLSAVVSGLLSLAIGSDIIGENGAALLRRLHVPQGVIALVTAGAEWGVLAIICISLVQGNASLAMGTIIGACLANILGAFALGLVLNKAGEGAANEQIFDRSSRIYASLLLVATVCVSACLLAPARYVVGTASCVAGSALVVIFVLHIVGVGYSITQGYMDPPEELADSDSDDDSQDSDDGLGRDRDPERARLLPSPSHLHPHSHGHPHQYPNYRSDSSTYVHPYQTPSGTGSASGSAASTPIHTPSPYTAAHGATARILAPGYGLYAGASGLSDTALPGGSRWVWRERWRTAVHVLNALFGTLLVLSGAYLVATASASLVLVTALSPVLFGIVVVGLFSTLPAKAAALLMNPSAAHINLGTLVANTAGNNLFLLLLGLGITYIVSGGVAGDPQAVLAIQEVVALLLATLTMVATVRLAAGPYLAPVGLLMGVALVVFIVVDIVIIRRQA